MMYPKLALNNIRKNSRTYFPYILTCIFTIAMYYIMKSLSLNKDMQNVFGGATAAEILKLGSNVVAIFAFIFLFYTNSFLTKNRKKEFGLFNILGMEKRHIAKVIGYESIYVALISFVCGFGVGILLDKLMYVAVSRLMKTEIALGFYISTEAIKNVLLLFGVLFLLIFLNSLRMIHLSKPIELLKGGNTGEKEPKAKWFIALLGLICLGGGYYIFVTTKHPLMALSLFFVAVILVVIGTYLLFTAGSIAFLKILKKSRNYYYKTKHFISISGMIYRMKQNAVGLANICILSTMVLVMVSSTASLMVGIEDILMERHPYQLEFNAYTADKDKFQGIVDIVDATAEQEDVAITEQVCYTSLQFSAIYSGSTEFQVLNDGDMSLLENVHNLNFITVADYNKFTGREVTLADDEVLFYSNRDAYANDSFVLFDKTYHIVEHTKEYPTNGLMSADLVPTFGIIVNSADAIDLFYEKQKEIFGDNASTVISYCAVDIDGDAEMQKAFYDKVWEAAADYIHENDIPFYAECRENSRQDSYTLYGSLFFLGIFLGLLFTMATVLIIYYKQISEGYDDKNRFEIMQKVGMSRQEVKSSIHSQVLTVFFLPLIMAGIHTAFAFPIVRKILAMLQLTNVKLFAISTVFVFLAFAVIYGIIYLLTAKIYYRIVRK